MTAEETAQFYKDREAYRRKCEDFREEMFQYLSHDGNNKTQKHEQAPTQEIYRNS